MSRRPSPNPSKNAIYQRRWRAKQPKKAAIPRKPSDAQLLRDQFLASADDKIGIKYGRIEMYRKRQKERYRWNAVLRAGKDLRFGSDTYSYADAIYRLHNKPVKACTPQAEYQRRYRARLRASVPENVLKDRLFAVLPVAEHETLHQLLHLVRNPVAAPQAPAEPKETPLAPITTEQRHQAVLDAGRDLDFDGETYYHEDALWWEKNK
jgi:hypothetical protein